jgi:putative transposase
MDGYAHTPATTKRLAVSQQGCLDQRWFASLDDARTVIAAWREDYNTVRPHTALANLTPAAYKANRIHQLRSAKNG